MDARKILGNEITNVRTSNLKITQKELAKRLGISVVYVSYLEMGKKTPSPELLENLYKLTGESDIPDNVMKMLSNAKKQIKKELTDSKLQRLLKETSEEPGNLYEVLESLLEKNKIEEAKNHILKSIPNISGNQEKKLLESLYFQLEGNYVIAVKLLKEAVTL